MVGAVDKDRINVVIGVTVTSAVVGSDQSADVFIAAYCACGVGVGNAAAESGQSADVFIAAYCACGVGVGNAAAGSGQSADVVTCPRDIACGIRVGDRGVTTEPDQPANVASSADRAAGVRVGNADKASV